MARTARAMEAADCAVALEESEQHSERDGGSAVVTAVAADEDAPAAAVRPLVWEAARGDASRRRKHNRRVAACREGARARERSLARTENMYT